LVKEKYMSTRRFAAIMILALTMIAFLAGPIGSQEPEKGKLYLMSERQTVTQRAGVPCIEENGNYCHRNFRCDEGHIARGILMNIDGQKGAGFGVTCADPNEVYHNYDRGAFGDKFSGKVYREPCDVGFYLAGAKFFTNDQKTISGVRAVCRRYWPVEEREGINTYGGGHESIPLVCEPGKFVSGVKVSYFQDEETAETDLISIRFYCAEMRHYLGLPDKKKDPRSKK
jgi:hypothetical protein